MTTIQDKLGRAVVDDAESGLFRCRRDIFTDPEIFELEMKHIFEGNWVYLAHESQIPEPNDYFTTSIGRQPIMITRDKEGTLHALINACAHRGAMICRRKHGNKGSFTCQFHGWTFGNTGKLLKVKDGKTGDYPRSRRTWSRLSGFLQPHSRPFAVLFDEDDADGFEATHQTLPQPDMSRLW